MNIYATSKYNADIHSVRKMLNDANEKRRMDEKRTADEQVLSSWCETKIVSNFFHFTWILGQICRAFAP